MADMKDFMPGFRLLLWANAQIFIAEKSLRQQRPDGLLVSHEHAPSLVFAITKSFMAGLLLKSALLTPKQ